MNLSSLINAWFVTFEQKAFFAKYCLDIWLHLLKQIFSEGQNQFSHASSFKPLLTNYFHFVFFTNNPISNQLLMDVIFGYPLIGQFDITYQGLKTYFLTYAWYFTFYKISFAVAHAKEICINHCEVEFCTVILILSSNKTIRTFTFCIIIQIVTQME